MPMELCTLPGCAAPMMRRVKAAMTAMNRCGELRVQNMATANTWVSGSVDEAELLKMLDNRPC